MCVKIYIVLFILLLSAGSCIREKCYNNSKADYHYLDPATLPWFGMFKDGSWWVYEEEKTGLRDSMYVKNYHHSFYGMGCEFREFNEGELISQYVLKNSQFLYSVESDIRTGFDTGFFLSLYYDSENDFFYYKRNDTIIKLNYLSKVKSYFNLLPLILNSDTIFFAKDIGIVRIVDEKNKRKFNLIKYEVVK